MKVGDKVRVVDFINEDYIGKEFTISGYSEMEDNTYLCDDDIHFFRESELELIEEYKPTYEGGFDNDAYANLITRRGRAVNDIAESKIELAKVEKEMARMLYEFTERCERILDGNE